MIFCNVKLVLVCRVMFFPIMLLLPLTASGSRLALLFWRLGEGGRVSAFAMNLLRCICSWKYKAKHTKDLQEKTINHVHDIDEQLSCPHSLQEIARAAGFAQKFRKDHGTTVRKHGYNFKNQNCRLIRGIGDKPCIAPLILPAKLGEGGKPVVC